MPGSRTAVLESGTNMMLLGTLLHPRRVSTFRAGLAAWLLAVATGIAGDPASTGLFARSNLVAWCIVPFDARKRGPEERAAMLEKLGIRSLAYDYRAEHIPAFDAEMDALKRHNIRLLAWWFPTTLNDEARNILAVLKRHELRKVQLWVMGAGEPTSSTSEQTKRVSSEAARLRPIAEEAAKLDGAVGLYNHGGWFGEPENQIAIIAELAQAGITNAGIVYNLHHGHDHLERFPRLLNLIKPHLLAINLNGMTRDGDKTGQKILPLAQGDLDLKILQIIQKSGWVGPIGILNHTDEDAEARLLDNLDGLDWLVPQLEDEQPGEKPKPRSWPEHSPGVAAAQTSTAAPSGASGTKPAAAALPQAFALPPGIPANSPYWAVEDAAEREKLPLFQIIEAARPEELTPANGLPRRELYRTWLRSHGDNGERASPRLIKSTGRTSRTCRPPGSITPRTPAITSSATPSSSAISCSAQRPASTSSA